MQFEKQPLRQQLKQLTRFQADGARAALTHYADALMQKMTEVIKMREFTGDEAFVRAYYGLRAARRWGDLRCEFKRHSDDSKVLCMVLEFLELCMAACLKAEPWSAALEKERVEQAKCDEMEDSLKKLCVAMTLDQGKEPVLAMLERAAEMVKRTDEVKRKMESASSFEGLLFAMSSARTMPVKTEKK
jgi:hypothetical protein